MTSRNLVLEIWVVDGYSRRQLSARGFDMKASYIMTCFKADT